jgi:hypothetical protein
MAMRQLSCTIVSIRRQWSRVLTLSLLFMEPLDFVLLRAASRKHHHLCFNRGFIIAFSVIDYGSRGLKKGSRIVAGQGYGAPYFYTNPPRLEKGDLSPAHSAATQSRSNFPEPQEP